jgi:geranylgeranyl diphosphate synthase type II
VLAGDALQALAFGILATAQPRAPGSTAQLVAELAAAAGSTGVVGGQVLDITLEPIALDRGTADWIHRHKTGKLFRAAARMGGIAAGATANELAELGEVGDRIGVAFQILDDIHDAAKGRRRAGRPSTGRPDPANPRAPEFSCLSVYSVDEAWRRAESLAREARAAIGRFKGRSAPLTAVTALILKGLTP